MKRSLGALLWGAMSVYFLYKTFLYFNYEVSLPKCDAKEAQQCVTELFMQNLDIFLPLHKFMPHITMISTKVTLENIETVSQDDAICRCKGIVLLDNQRGATEKVRVEYSLTLTEKSDGFLCSLKRAGS